MRFLKSRLSGWRTRSPSSRAWSRRHRATSPARWTPCSSVPTLPLRSRSRARAARSWRCPRRLFWGTSSRLRSAARTAHEPHDSTSFSRPRAQRASSATSLCRGSTFCPRCGRAAPRSGRQGALFRSCSTTTSRGSWGRTEPRARLEPRARASE
eukprot:Amastigsp_a339356_1127.p3 type:complete len:154 gc:universal Amastigsp_a339356_1127:316-777(+)